MPLHPGRGKRGESRGIPEIYRNLGMPEKEINNLHVAVVTGYQKGGGHLDRATGDAGEPIDPDLAQGGKVLDRLNMAFFAGK